MNSTVHGRGGSFRLSIEGLSEKKSKDQVIASVAKQSLLEKEIASLPTAPRNDTTPPLFRQFLRGVLQRLFL
jgi:hypothetical protein